MSQAKNEFHTQQPELLVTINSIKSTLKRIQGNIGVYCLVDMTFLNLEFTPLFQNINLVANFSDSLSPDAIRKLEDIVIEINSIFNITGSPYKPLEQHQIPQAQALVTSVKEQLDSLIRTNSIDLEDLSVKWMKQFEKPTFEQLVEIETPKMTYAAYEQRVQKISELISKPKGRPHLESVQKEWLILQTEIWGPISGTISEENKTAQASDDFIARVVLLEKATGITPTTYRTERSTRGMNMKSVTEALAGFNDAIIEKRRTEVAELKQNIQTALLKKPESHLIGSSSVGKHIEKTKLLKFILESIDEIDVSNADSQIVIDLFKRVI